MIPVILSGGSGTRLWPVSRSQLPKQFCEIFDKTLHQTSLQRLSKLGQTPWIITSKSLQTLTLRDTKSLQIPTENIIFEPLSKNTAPAIALLCHVLASKGLQNSVVGVFPADHLIEKESLFYSALELAQESAQQGKVVLLGIQPSFPATGYGYIQVNAPPEKINSLESNLNIFSVQKFHEKPNLNVAQDFIKEGRFFWNAGIFVFKVQTMIEALQKHQAPLWKLISEVKADYSNLLDIYSKVESISLDYAIIEKLGSEQLRCVPCDIGWSDVGSWDAIQEMMSTVTPTNKIELQASNNFVHSKNKKVYAFIDIDDVIVVDTDDATLILKKGSSQSVKDLVDQLKISHPKVTQDHTFEYRPWGQYEILRDEKHFKSKALQILPQEQLSYQSHAHREEHWVIVAGMGEVVLNDTVIPVQKGSYVKVPQGAKHRIRNTGENELLELVEVQLGTYFGEEDIVRYLDDYQRV